jgi:hypothetical protein
MIDLTTDPPTLFGDPPVVRALCADGIARNVRLSPLGADTFFSVPGRVSVRGKTVSGYLTRETADGWTTETPDDPAVWKFVAYTYGRNAGMLPRGAWKRSDA